MQKAIAYERATTRAAALQRTRIPTLHFLAAPMQTPPKSPFIHSFIHSFANHSQFDCS